jgi:hypothetical protein
MLAGVKSNGHLPGRAFDASCKELTAEAAAGEPSIEQLIKDTVMSVETVM